MSTSRNNTTVTHRLLPILGFLGAKCTSRGAETLLTSITTKKKSFQSRSVQSSLGVQAFSLRYKKPACLGGCKLSSHLLYFAWLEPSLFACYSSGKARGIIYGISLHIQTSSCHGQQQSSSGTINSRELLIAALELYRLSIICIRSCSSSVTPLWPFPV